MATFSFLSLNCGFKKKKNLGKKINCIPKTSNKIHEYKIKHKDIESPKMT